MEVDTWTSRCPEEESSYHTHLEDFVPSNPTFTTLCIGGLTMAGQLDLVATSRRLEQCRGRQDDPSPRAAEPKGLNASQRAPEVGASASRSNAPLSSGSGAKLLKVQAVFLETVLTDLDLSTVSSRSNLLVAVHMLSLRDP
ncbi:hypothetical protein GCM10009674_04130 [Nesterenkonia xinjiangensis]